ncbi:hypothetical protein REPUB_Repub11eG0008700 [Reevesia pubescens]
MTQKKKSNFYKPKLENKEKPEYAPKPNPKEKEKPYYGTKPEEKENILSIGVEGLVLRKSGSKYYLIQGAVAKVRCQVVDHIRLEKTLPIYSVPTDAKGYFFATISSLSLADRSLKLKD